MSVLYVTSPPLLDYSIEQIKDLKRHVDLHVIIFVNLGLPNHTIFNIDNSTLAPGLYEFNEIQNKIVNVKLLTVYLIGCKSIHFVFFANKFSIDLFTNTQKLLVLKNRIKPRIVHFDDISGRLFAFVMLLRNVKIILNIHDPIAHSGEKKYFYILIRKLLFKKVSGFATFSNYSFNLFKNKFQPKVSVADLRLLPYNSYKLTDPIKIPEIFKKQNEIILLFFGRISPYKGIDELLIAFSQISRKYPNVKLIIAGSGNYSYQIPTELIGSKSLIVLNRFISTGEVNTIFDNVDLLICPYRDATQSGVLMTAAVFNIPVLVSNVGALPEYIKEGGRGFVYNQNDASGLKKHIESFLNNELELLKQDNAYLQNNIALQNSRKLIKLYDIA